MVTPVSVSAAPAAPEREPEVAPEPAPQPEPEREPSPPPQPCNYCHYISVILEVASRSILNKLQLDSN